MSQFSEKVNKDGVEMLSCSQCNQVLKSSNFSCRNAQDDETILSASLRRRDYASYQSEFATKSISGIAPPEFSHTAEYIRAETEELLQVYGLDLSKVFKVVTDNGSNMKNAFMDETQLVPNADEFNDDDWDEDEDEDFDPFVDESILRDAFPRRLSCFAHTLQLVLMKIFKLETLVLKLLSIMSLA
uniref:Transposase n=1 Tax=Ditylenchus dipsaci TaxID=166011 RepID=A0A915E973_9BILA